MPPKGEKRKSNVSPNTKKNLAATSKFRKSEKQSLPTGEVADEEDEIEDIEVDDDSFEFNKDTEPSEKHPMSCNPISIVTVEIIKLNNKTFDDLLTREERKQFWVNIGRKLNEVQQISFKRVPNKCLQLIFKLKSALQITDVSKKSEFEVEVKNSNGTNIFTVRLPDFEDIKAELGKVVPVTIFKTIKLDVADVADWLELYGFIQGDFRSVLHLNNHPVILADFLC